MKNYFFVLLTILMISCSNEHSMEIHEELITEVYDVRIEDNETVIGDLNFKESYVYNKAGVEIGHFIYDTIGNLSFKEMYNFDEDGRLIGSSFIDLNGNELSHYKITLDKEGRKKSSHGFDSSTNELLRIEDFTYDMNGNLNSKTVLTPELQMVSKQIYDNDGIGNHVGIRIIDGKGNVIFEEQYRTTKYNDQNQWMEKWGLVNNEPYSYRKRILKRY